MTDEKEPKPRGPDPERLKLDGDWEAAVKKVLHKKPPARRPRRKPKRRK